MSQETKQFDNDMNQETSNPANIDSSSNITKPQEEKKYAFNQAEVNRDDAPNQNSFGGNNNKEGYCNNLHGQQPNVNQPQNGQAGPNGQWNGQPRPNSQWQGQAGPNGQWQGQPRPNQQWNGQPGPNNGWQQAPNGQWQQRPNGGWQQPGPNGQWQRQGGPNRQWNGQAGPSGQWNGQPRPNGQAQNSQQYSNNTNSEKKTVQNPFKMFNEPVKVPKIKTNEDARNVYFGVNQEYYNKVYKEYKAGKKISWNWSAFIFRSYWFFSRKMYAVGALYTVMMSFISLSVYQIAENMSNPQILAMILPWAIVFFALWAAAGMFGNYIYMAHMENKIVYPSDKVGSTEQITQINVMRGGFSVYGVILCFMATDLILTLVQYIAGML